MPQSEPTPSAGSPKQDNVTSSCHSLASGLKGDKAHALMAARATGRALKNPPASKPLENLENSCTKHDGPSAAGWQPHQEPDGQQPGGRPSAEKPPAPLQRSLESMLGLRTPTTMAGPKACSQPVDLPRKLIGHSGSQVVEEGLRKKCSVFRRWTKRRSLVRDEKQPWHGRIQTSHEGMPLG